MLNFEPRSFDIAITNGVPIIQFSWGMPTKEMVSKMKTNKVVLGIQVTSEASAKAAIDLGADYLVCQGTEAGGHVHASKPLAEALKRVLVVSGSVPVVASGGIATGHKMREYMQMGAAGVVMGLCRRALPSHPPTRNNHAPTPPRNNRKSRHPKPSPQQQQASQSENKCA